VTARAGVVGPAPHEQRGDHALTDYEHVPQSRFGFLLNQASRALRSTLAGELRLHGIGEDQWVVLRNAYERERSGKPQTTPRDLAAQLNMRIEDIGAAAESLAREGWITLGGKAADRKPVITLTDKARRVLPGLVDVSNWTAERALNGFTNEEVEQLTANLQRLCRNLGT
jgi:DNA-binding MarR family transcriptional regulator